MLFEDLKWETTGTIEERIQKWFDQSIEVRLDNSPHPEDRAIKDIFAELIVVNGGRGYHGYGVIAVGGPCGRSGLTGDESRTLMILDSVLAGMIAIYPRTVEIAEEIVMPIVERLRTNGRNESVDADEP